MRLIDKLISYVSPQTALKRFYAHKRLEVLNSGYGDHGASTYKKSLAGWITRSRSPADDIIGQSSYVLKNLRQRTRDLHMSAPLAASALKTTRTNVVGCGLTLKSQIDYEVLGMSAQEANSWQKNTEREFSLWATNECDITRMMDFGEIQRLAFLATLMSGDVFAPMPYKKFEGDIYGTKIMLIEADRVDTPPDLTANPLIRGGVKVDEQGTVQAYYITKTHPLDSRAGIGAMEFDEYEAFGKKTGRRNILHLMQFERPGQVRGVPMLAPVIETLKMLTEYTKTELMGAVVSGMFTVFVTAQNPEQPFAEANRDESYNILAGNDDYKLGSGAIIGLNPGEKIETANPTRPNTAFDPFVLALCRQIGAAIELPYEILIKHFTASYSAARAALLEAWKFFKQQRYWLASRFCQPIYEQWLYEAVAIGRIEAPGFMEDKLIRAAYSKALWYGPSQGQIDPDKEVGAAIKRIDNKLSTREREAMELTGADFEDIAIQLELEEKILKDNGIQPKQDEHTQQEEQPETILENKDGTE